MTWQGYCHNCSSSYDGSGCYCTRKSGETMAASEKDLAARRAAFKAFEDAAGTYNQALINEQNSRAALERVTRELKLAKNYYKDAKAKLLELMPDLDPVHPQSRDTDS